MTQIAHILTAEIKGCCIKTYSESSNKRIQWVFLNEFIAFMYDAQPTASLRKNGWLKEGIATKDVDLAFLLISYIKMKVPVYVDYILLNAEWQQ